MASERQVLLNLRTSDAKFSPFISTFDIQRRKIRCRKESDLGAGHGWTRIACLAGYPVGSMLEHPPSKLAESPSLSRLLEGPSEPRSCHGPAEVEQEEGREGGKEHK